MAKLLLELTRWAAELMSYCELAGVDERCERVSLFTHREILNGSGLPHASSGQSDSQSWRRGAGGGGWEVKRLGEKRLCSFSPKDILILCAY